MAYLSCKILGGICRFLDMSVLGKNITQLIGVYRYAYRLVHTPTWWRVLILCPGILLRWWRGLIVSIVLTKFGRIELRSSSADKGVLLHFSYVIPVKIQHSIIITCFVYIDVCHAAITEISIQTMSFLMVNNSINSSDDGSCNPKS